MELKPGYKQTEVGMIPEDWEVQPLASLTEKIMVGIASAATHAYRIKGVPMFRNQNIKPGLLDDEDLLFVDAEYEKTFRNKRLRGGDLLTARTGYPGTTCVVPARYQSAQSFTTLITRPDTNKINSTFLCVYINSEAGQKFFELSQIGGAQKNVNAGTLRKMPVPIPPPSEQREISDILSNVDTLLASLDRLIAKKRDIKQAAMQELLTGKRRLPGFEAEWEVKKLGEIATISMGRTPSRAKQEFWGSGHTWLSIADLKSKIVTDSKEAITDSAASTMSIIPKGTLLMSFKLSIGRLCFAGRDLFTNEAICSFNALDASGEFLYYVLGRTDFSLYGKQAVKGYTLNKESLQTVEVRLPVREEQDAIASVLSSIDDEILIMEERREKALSIKQGMMQQLLTGKIRLK